MLFARALLRLSGAWLLVGWLVTGCGHDAPPWGWDRWDERWQHPPLAIVHIDVGQGDATLIVGPADIAVLIDGGPVAAGRTLTDVLAALQIDTLDSLLITHPDADHVGGLAALIDAGVEVIAAWGNASASDSEAYQQFISALAGTEAGWVQVMDPGDQIELGEGARLACTVSGGRLLDGRQLAVSGTNDRSLGLKIEYAGFDYHVGGDLGASVEQELGPLVGDLDVVHLHHHGSAGSTSAAWLNAVRPEVAVLSVGRNGYDHPAWEVVERLTGGDDQVGVPLPEVVQTGAGERLAGRVLGTFSVVTDGLRYDLDGRLREVDAP